LLCAGVDANLRGPTWMPLPETLSTCISDLASQCESLHERNELLSSENASLRSKLFAFLPPELEAMPPKKPAPRRSAAAAIVPAPSLELPTRSMELGSPIYILKSASDMSEDEHGMACKAVLSPPVATSEVWASGVVASVASGDQPSASGCCLSGRDRCVRVAPSVEPLRSVHVAFSDSAPSTWEGLSISGSCLSTSGSCPKVPGVVEEDAMGTASSASGDLTARRDHSEDQSSQSKDGRVIQTLAAARLGMIHNEAKKAHVVAAPSRSRVGISISLDSIQTITARFVRRRKMGALADHVFRSFSVVMIVANTLHIGISSDHALRNSYRPLVGQEKESEPRTLDILFACWFTLELIIRIFRDKKDFFFGEEHKWNLFDGFLVLTSIFEPISMEVLNLSFLRILRVFRLVRVVRVVRTVKALKSLRTMVFALANSFVCLMWAFVMILIIVFVFSIVFNSAVVNYFEQVNLKDENELETAKAVEKHFGNLKETMVSLFCAITGGNDWMAYGDLLRELPAGEMYFLLFAFYVGFCIVGMLNVVTGIFVDSAVCTRTEDEVVECFTEDQRRISEEVKRIFKEADKDRSNTLSFAEFTKHLENAWVRAYFSGLDMDPSEAEIIFTLIDIDNSGEVDIDEFVEGTMKLKGSAKSIDVLSMMFDSARYQVKFNQLCNFIEEQLRGIRETLTPGSVPDARIFDRDDVGSTLAAYRRLSHARTFEAIRCKS